MTWLVINETGAVQATKSGDRMEKLLHAPTYAMQADDGSYLIVDELGREKQVPFSFGCRTVRVDVDGTVLYDSQSSGIDDGFGCLRDDGQLAILRRTKWELLIVAPDGGIVDRLHMDTFSKRLPRFVSWTCNGTYLVVFFNRALDLDIIEVDRQGRLLWCLPSRAGQIGLPASAQLTRSDTILIADPIRHVAMEIDRTGNVVWQFGETKHPSRRIDHLSSPGSARRLADGRCVIADSRNHRVLLIDVDGKAREIMPRTGTLRDPSHADVLRNGNFLICDTGNGRIIELDEQGDIVWQYGATNVNHRLLSYPRSVEVTATGGYLVADTAHDRVIEIHDGQISERPFLDQPGLFWPRCVRLLPSGSLLIADARNSRIVEVSTEGYVVRALTHIDLNGSQALEDPHDVRPVADDRLLITDSHHDMVVVVDWTGRIHQIVGGADGDVSLEDPHSAQQLDDGSIAIADTGHHRIVIVDPDNRVVREIGMIQDGSTRLRLNSPRYVEVIHDGTMVIADTGNNRILATDDSSQLIWEFSYVPDSPIPGLNQPRWVKLLNRNEVVICDHFHHRILHVRYVPS
jgi:hypothetical protein